MRVVHCKIEPYTHYIGRGSVFGNPFTHIPIDRTKASVQVGSVKESIQAFDDWANERAWHDVEPERRKEMVKAIYKLPDDAVLGCFCKTKPDKVCHGDVIVRMRTSDRFIKVESMSINIDTLLKNLALLDENILAEAARQPLLFIDAARYRVAAMKNRAKAVAEADYRRSRIALAIRAKRNEAGDKVTEASLKERVEKHSIVRQMREAVERAYETEEFSKLILEAYRMRRDAIRVIAESQIAEGMRETKELEHIEQRQKMRNVVRDLDSRRSRIKETEGDDE